jgi:hypothetical protein
MESCSLCGSEISSRKMFCQGCKVYLPKEEDIDSGQVDVKIAIISRMIRTRRTLWNLSNLLTLFPAADLDYLRQFAIYFTSTKLGVIKLESVYEIGKGATAADPPIGFPTQEIMGQNSKSNFQDDYEAVDSISVSAPVFHNPPVASSYYSGRLGIKLIGSKSTKTFETNQFQWISLKRALTSIPRISEKIVLANERL